MAQVESYQDAFPPSPASELSTADSMRSNSASDQTASTAPTSNLSSRQMSSNTASAEPGLPKDTRESSGHVNNAFDTLMSASRTRVSLPKKTARNASKASDTPVKNAEALFDWGMNMLSGNDPSTVQEDAALEVTSDKRANKQPAKQSARLQSSAKSARDTIKETISVLGKRGRDAVDSTKERLRSSANPSKERRKSLRVRLTDEEKESQRQAAEEHARAPETGNRPKLPKGWAYVHEPTKKSTRLSEAQNDQKKHVEEVEFAEIESTRPVDSKSQDKKKPTKVWLEKGLYAGNTSTFDPKASGLKNRQRREAQFGSLDELEQKGTFMSLPMFAGDELLKRGRHFKLPFDVFSPLPREPKPEEWKKIRSNRFVGDAIHLWKHQAPEEMSQCMCTPETGCGENCLNRGMFYECDDRNCPLDKQTCTNRPFTTLVERVKTGKKYEIGVEVLQTAFKGHGVRACRTFNENQIIVEYAGEIITKEECERRMMNEYKGKSDFYLMEFNQSMIIDATKGSIARFVNHSCEPNCTMEQWVVHGKPRMALFAKRDIMTGEELTYDYNFDPFSTKNIQTCHCGSDFCRGSIGPKFSREKEKAHMTVLELEKEDHQVYLRSLKKPFPKYKPSAALADARKRLADLFGQTVEQFFSKKDKASDKNKAQKDDDEEQSPKAKKQRTGSSTFKKPEVPKRVSSLRKVTVTSKRANGQVRRQSAVSLSTIASKSSQEASSKSTPRKGSLSRSTTASPTKSAAKASPKRGRVDSDVGRESTSKRRRMGLDLSR